MFPVLESKSDMLKMLDELSHERAAILERCRTLSVQQLNDPVYVGTWSVLQNLSHLAWAEEFMLAWILKRPEPLGEHEYPKEPALALDELATALDEAHAAVIAFVKGNDAKVFAEPCRYVARKDHQTVGGVLYHLVAHEIGHRTFVLHKLARLTNGIG